jgi:hypothetical protein
MSFPSVGDKLKFIGVPKVYYPMFTNMRKEAAEHLEDGKVYTVTRVEVYSSWCAVWVDNKDVMFNLQFFRPLFTPERKAQIKRAFEEVNAAIVKQIKADILERENTEVLPRPATKEEGYAAMVQQMNDLHK